MTLSLHQNGIDLGKKLPLEYFQQSDVVLLSKDLIGKKLCTNFNDQFSSGIITETEAYNGRTDKACHAFGGLRTKRTETIYQQGGIAYVYLCYGIHHLLNFVTNHEGLADAILIRAIEPIDGVDVMLERRNKPKLDKTLSSGPGTLSQALGISTKNNGILLNSDDIWVEDAPFPVREQDIETTTRIGVDYAGEDALLPWRFYLKTSQFVSKR